MSSTLFWITIILLVLILALVIWLLFTGNGSTEPTKKKLNQSCAQTSHYNTGLVCDISKDSSGVCKVPSGGVCTVDSECAEGLECNDGVCMAKGGDLNEPCPCNEGFTCIDKVCKAINGEPCRHDSDCADGRCCGGVCLYSGNYKTSSSCGSSECSRYSKYTKDCSEYTSYKHNHGKYKKSKSYDDISFSDDDSHYSYCKSLSSGRSSDCTCSSDNSRKYSSYTVSSSLY